MKTNIVIPTKIKVGSQERNDTYTGKLAYIIYFDHKGVLRKETSWQNWRDKSIEPEDYDNVPTSGFVLNKKVGDCQSHYNHRQAYIRVYDPRGFEFEISVENLLYILENTSSIVGKGLEGEFIYGWLGKDLVLLPTSSPDYKEIVSYNNALANNKITAKTLKVGATYLNKKNKKLTYMGYFDTYDRDYEADSELKLKNDYYNRNYMLLDKRYKKTKKHWFFTNDNNHKHAYFITLSNASSIIELIDENPHSDYSKMYEFMEHKEEFSPYTSHKKDTFIPLDINTLLEHDAGSNFYIWFLDSINELPSVISVYKWSYATDSVYKLVISRNMDISNISTEILNLINKQEINQEELKLVFKNLVNPMQRLNLLENGKNPEGVKYNGN